MFNASAAASFVAFVFVLCLTSCGRPENGQSSAAKSLPRYESAAAVFEVYRDAKSKQDWRSTFACLTPDMQKHAIFETYFQLGLLGSAEATAIENKYLTEPESMKQEIEAKYKRKYGADAWKRKEAPASDETGEPPPSDHEIVVEAFAAHTPDQVGFYEAGNQLVKRGSSDAPLGKLANIKVRGDFATGSSETTFWHLEQEANGPSRKVVEPSILSFHFQKINGGWLIDAPQEN